MKNLVLRTEGKEFAMVDRDLVIFTARFIKHYNKKLFMSKYIKKHFVKLLPDAVYDQGNYGATIMGIKNAIKALAENGAINEVPVKNYKLIEIADTKVLNKVAGNKFEAIEVDDKTLENYFSEIMELEGDNKVSSGKYENKSIAVNSLF